MTSFTKQVLSISDPPFACPPDIVLTIPAPPPVNKTRRIDWRNHKGHMAWRNRAHSSVLLIPREQRRPISGGYWIDIVIDDSLKCDADALLKNMIDYCVVAGLVEGDSKKYLRGGSFRWGCVHGGDVQITLRSAE